MNNKFKRLDIDFYSDNTRCSAWFYLPNLDKKCPVIIMAAGLGGVRDMYLDAYAERFASAGYACFLFDYRNMGASDGKQRQRINVKEQLEDWNCAIDFIKQNDLIDSNKITLFGCSFSGGHVITLSAKRNDILATIAQCPYTNNIATMRAIPFLSVIKMFPYIVADMLASLVGAPAVMLKLADAPGKAALMAVSDYEKCLNLVPNGSLFENKTPARTALEFLKYSPGKYAKKISIPILYAVCMADTICPAPATIRRAKQSAQAVIKEYNCGHFDICIGEYFENTVKDHIGFLDKNIK